MGDGSCRAGSDPRLSTSTRIRLCSQGAEESMSAKQQRGRPEDVRRHCATPAVASSLGRRDVIGGDQMGRVVALACVEPCFGKLAWFCAVWAVVFDAHNPPLKQS